MTKTDMVSSIAKETGTTQKQAQAAMTSLTGSITAALRESGDDVKLVLPGFGTFRKARREKRQGRNPQTGEPMTIPARSAVVFKPGKQLKEAVQ